MYPGTGIIHCAHCVSKHKICRVIEEIIFRRSFSVLETALFSFNSNAAFLIWSFWCLGGVLESAHSGEGVWFIFDVRCSQCILFSLRVWDTGLWAKRFAAQAKCIFLLDWFESLKFTTSTMLAVMLLLTALCFCCRAIFHFVCSLLVLNRRLDYMAIGWRK